MCTSLPSEDKAKEMARQIIDAKLAFCCWIRPKHFAIYSWEGALQEEFELELICKTFPDKTNALKVFIQSQHPYSVPYIGEFEGFLIQENYIQWAKGVVSS
jgi:periplasmic divalent cation tolerance protein